MTEIQKKIEYLVADTTAFINAVQLNEYAKNVLTVPDVVTEVRNKRQIRRLCVLPFDLQVREPRTESVRHCVEFSKKTGDYASLSGIDIKVVALTYELEVENVGTAHLRQEPVLSRVIASTEKPEEFQDNSKMAGWYNPNIGDESDDYDEEDEDANDAGGIDEGNKSDEEHKDGNNKSVDIVKEAIEKELEQKEPSQANLAKVDNEQEEITQEELDQLFEKLRCEPEENDKSCDLLVPQSKQEEHYDTNSTDCGSDTDELSPKCQNNDYDAEAEDDGNWITPSNIKKVKKSLEGKVEDDIVPAVACMSTDFAVQNVVKQLNLNLCGLNGRVIKHLRTYILRCYACFKTTSIMTKVFCPNCGNKTLKRVAVSLDEHGKQVIHVNTRRPLSTKYKNQSLPRFHGGKHSRNPIMFEDQPIPRQMPSRVAKTKTNALEEDYIAGFSPFVMRDVDSKSAMLRSKGHLKEWARNNTFEEDRRRKHYNRLYK